jgi:hypothetical protein
MKMEVKMKVKMKMRSHTNHKWDIAHSC